MKRVPIFLMSFSFLSSCGSPFSSETEIISGKITKEAGFMAGLVSEVDAESTFCGGTFIGPKLVMTAAHCVDGEAIWVKPGIAKPALLPSIKVEAVVVHPGYGTEEEADFALLFLEDYDEDKIKVSPIGINRLGDFPSEKERLTVYGRGNTTSFGWLGSALVREVDVSYLDQKTCQDAYGEASISDAMLCAGSHGIGGRDSCQGDSGGPLVSWVDGVVSLVGVVSWGQSCAQKEYPGVYSRVSYIANWVDTTILSVTLPKAEPSAVDLGEYVDRFCFDAPLSRRIVENEDDKTMRSLRQALMMGEFKRKTLVDPSEEESLCSFSVGGGENFLFSVDDKDNPKVFSLTQNGRRWEAPVLLTDMSLSLNCFDSLNLSMNYSLVNHDFSLSVGGNYYLSEEEFLGEIPEDALRFHCKVLDTSVDFYLGMVDGKMNPQ